MSDVKVHERAHAVDLAADAARPATALTAAGIPATGVGGGLRRDLGVWWDVFLMRLAGIREFWYWYVMGWLVFPLALLLFMSMATAGDPRMAAYLIAGNVVFGLVIGPIQFISNDLAWARQRNDLDFFATLPISRLQLVMAILAVTALSSVPGAVANLVLGSWILGQPLQWHPFVPAVIVLSILSMSGIGVMIGVYARSGQHANVLNNLILVVVTFLSPIFVPSERLPAVLQWTARLLPTTYAAHALRTTISGQAVGVPADLGVLAAWAVLTLWFATQKLEWRRD